MNKQRVALVFLLLTSLSEVFAVNEVTYRCDEGWEIFEDRCYRIPINSFLQKPVAVNVCNNINAELFVPSSPEEYSAVTSYVNNIVTITRNGNPPSPITDVWIGCDDEEVEGTFRCTDGTTFNSTKGWWKNGEPTNGQGTALGNEDCVIYKKDEGLNDYPCDETGFGSQILCEAAAKLYKVSRDYALISRPDGTPLKGYCLKGHSIFSARVQGLVQCADLCVARESCLSFNWQQQHGNCEINRNTSSAAGENSIKQREGCNYFELVEKLEIYVV